MSMPAATCRASQPFLSGSSVRLPPRLGRCTAGGVAPGNSRREPTRCEMGGEYKESFADVQKLLVNFLNYK